MNYFSFFSKDMWYVVKGKCDEILESMKSNIEYLCKEKTLMDKAKSEWKTKALGSV